MVVSIISRHNSCLVHHSVKSSSEPSKLNHHRLVQMKFKLIWISTLFCYTMKLKSHGWNIAENAAKSSKLKRLHLEMDCKNVELWLQRPGGLMASGADCVITTSTVWSFPIPLCSFPSKSITTLKDLKLAITGVVCVMCLANFGSLRGDFVLILV